jgi:hypothetical protein
MTLEITDGPTVFLVSRGNYIFERFLSWHPTLPARSYSRIETRSFKSADKTANKKFWKEFVMLALLQMLPSEQGG